MQKKVHKWPLLSLTKTIADEDVFTPLDQWREQGEPCLPGATQSTNWCYWLAQEYVTPSSARSGADRVQLRQVQNWSLQCYSCRLHRCAKNGSTGMSHMLVCIPEGSCMILRPSVDLMSLSMLHCNVSATIVDEGGGGGATSMIDRMIHEAKKLSVYARGRSKTMIYLDGLGLKGTLPYFVSLSLLATVDYTFLEKAPASPRLQKLHIARKLEQALLMSFFFFLFLQKDFFVL